MNNQKNYISLKPQDIAIAYLLLRILIGVNYFNHGFTRIFDIPGFAEGIVEQLKDSYFPEFMVRINSYLVPPVELIVGILITIGLATRSALIATFILMIILKMGVTSVQNWGAATSMLTYALVLFILLAGHSFNIYSLDHWRNNKQTTIDSATSKPQSPNNFSLFFSKFTKKRRRQHRSYLR
ncbi:MULTISPECIES: DoxX family protein [unclassified Nodularia (in: cyanobacteria)]|uniref:DoxX family protein n=1 Tax=unclassified Nodularia (in: cyanobacteria) TaxID=2656917 RepID=UPI001881DB9C|nr:MULTISPECIES: DoxX family protein [unclassified Nodularia (in: cyanobacteria)]MBE9199476.1 DoxX family protein [Nodularia sp. LEGE 06071]MCC2695238.1 DoxX family protein [Nodularia sp. LEGE 04288]